ncbi:hypothetical protein BACI9J_560002 [Bacillus altitudinis]|nr:hypothetical protein BACI9J_560002 [Bacillus altitudinis]
MPTSSPGAGFHAPCPAATPHQARNAARASEARTVPDGRHVAAWHRASRPVRSALEARLALVGKPGLDACAHVLGHVGQCVEPGPERLGVLAVGGVRRAGDVPAGEDQVEVLRAVAVRVGHLGQHLDPRQAFGGGDDVRFFQDLAFGGDGGFLARVDDPGDRGVRAGVGPPNHEQFAIGAGAAGHDGAHARQPERCRADLLAQGQDEVGGRHSSTLPTRPLSQTGHDQ